MASTPDSEGITGETLDQYISDCASNDPCAASWQAAYVWHSDQMYRLAIFQALQAVAFGLLEFTSADRTADKQYDIADRQMRIAEEEYQRYKDHYVECEDALAAEICAMECAETDYETRADRATRDVRKQFAIARANMQRSRLRYCAADMFHDLCSMEKAEALAVVQARDIAYRYAETYRDILDQRRWERRVVILQHGRNIMTGQSSIYDSGANGAIAALSAGHEARTNLYGTMSGALGAIINARFAQRIANYNPISAHGASTARPMITQNNIMQSGISPYAQSGVAPFGGPM